MTDTDRPGTAGVDDALTAPDTAPDTGTAAPPSLRGAADRANPVVAAGSRTPADVVTEELVAQLTAHLPGGATAHSHSPFTGEPLARLPQADAAQVADAFARARAAQREWADRPVRERATVLLRFHDLVLRHREAALDLVQSETGKARLHAFEEVMAVAVAARHYGRAAPALLRPQRHTGALPLLTRVRELRHPRGVVGQIVPWNYPLELSVGDALPAFVAGNAVVMKPDNQTALTALWARRLLVEAGLPPDVWQVVLGEGPTIGPELVTHADFVSFTGSTRTGRQVAQGAAARLVGSSLELGGKNAMLVLADADPDKAAAGAVRGAFSSAGQLCIHLERIYVEEPVADAFVRKLVERTRALRLGTVLGYGADLGSLVSARQLATVTRHVREAVAQGAEVLAGGRHRPDVGPYFHEPTVLTGVAEPMAVCTEETFGPVVAVYRVDSAEEAIERANASTYGLNSSVWSRNARRARAVAARLRTGTVNVNEGYASAYGSAQAPMGGRGESGWGRRHGVEGLLKYTESQTVAEQRVLPLAPAWGMDDAQYAAWMTRGLRVLKGLRFR